MDLAVIWNAHAGGAGALDPHDVTRRVARATSREVTLLEIEKGRAADRCVEAALSGGARTIVAAGGDGTVSACAAALLGRSIELGVLPIGTSNSFAAALELPSDLDAAIAYLASGERRRIDVAQVTNGEREKVMILHCMIGFHAEAIVETTSASKRQWGVLAYVATALRRLATLEPFAVELATASHRVRCRATAIAVANLAPVKTVLAHGPSHLLGDDGRVDVTIVSAETIVEAIATGVHLWRSARDHEPAIRDNVGSFSATHVTITADPPQRVLVDGEDFGETPIEIETLRQALTVIAPVAASADGEPIEAELLGLPDLEVDGTG